MTDDTKSYTRIMFHEIYESEENIDTLLLGSSHCYRTLNPAILDASLGPHTFNGGTSAQSLDGTYTILKEVGKTNQLSHVYVELYYGIRGFSTKDRDDLTKTYIISDYMKPSFNKLTYLLQASTNDFYINSFLLPHRNPEKLLCPDYLMELWQKKASDSYRTYSFIINENEYYAGRGYVASNESLSNETMVETASLDRPLPDTVLSSDDKKYMTKIISYCNKKGIALTFFSSPIPELRLLYHGNYDSYIDEVKSFLEPYDINYYDFNLCYPESMGLVASDYKDTSHLNDQGATKFSTLFAQVMADPESFHEVAYPTYQEKMDALPAGMYGTVIVKDSEAEQITAYPVVNKIPAPSPIVLSLSDDESDTREIKFVTSEGDYTYLYSE